MRNQTCVVQASAVLWGLVRAGWGVLVQEKCPGSWLALARAAAFLFPPKRRASGLGMTHAAELRRAGGRLHSRSSGCSTYGVGNAGDA